MKNSENGLPKGNRKHKDSVFIKLFDSKEKIIPLYNAVCNENCPLDAEIKINTLENTLFMNQVNDLSFTIDDRCIVLIEHQSTINENMPLRMLSYVSKLFEGIVSDGQYRRNLCKLPKPEFTVLYNGTEDFPEKKTYKLSDAFIGNKKGKINLELIVNVVNINYGKNKEVLEKSKDLNDYSHFIELIREFLKQKMELNEAIEKAMKEAKKLGILQDFLAKHEKEVARMLYDEFDLDACLATEREEAEAKGREEGLKEGRAEGEKNAFLRFVEGMRQNGLTEEKIQSIVEKSGMMAFAY